MRKYPPLNSLRAFDSAARHLSFSKAADELAVTQSAVSKQIKLLENYLGKTLFERKHQQIALTPAAAVYAQTIGDALDIVSAGTDALIVHEAATETLHVNALPTLTSKWLIPLLEEFKQLYPHIAVTIDSGDGDIDFASVEADVALRASRTGVFSGIYSEQVFGENLVPVCVPELKVESISQLAGRPLIEHTTRPSMWGEFFAAMNCEIQNRGYELGLEHYYMVVQAALDGLGVALVPKFLVEKELTAGDLVLALNSNFQSPYTYYLLAPSHKVGQKKVQVFMDWLRSKVAE